MAVIEFFLLLQTFAAISSLAFAGSVMTPSTSLTHDQKLSSPGNIFELVFFSPDSAKTYLGIRYSQDHELVVWVANRNASLPTSAGALNLTEDGNLVLYDNASDNVVWSTNTPAANPQLQLLDSGNLMLTDLARNTTLWQSFDHPCDTSVPGIKLGVLNLQDGSASTRRLVSWKKSHTDPSPGAYSYEMETREVAEFYIKKGPDKLFRTGPWNGRTFSGYPDLPRDSQLKYSFVSDSSGVYYFTEADDPSLLSRAVMNLEKYVRYQRKRDDPKGSWNLKWSLPNDQCDNYQTCGPNSICNPSYSSVSCDCIEGFVKVTASAEDGCKRGRPLDCQTDKFRLVGNVKLPETVNATADNSKRTKEQCEDRCLRDCLCTAYAVIGPPSGCVTWHGNLSDLRTFPIDGGDEIYVRLSASEFEDEKQPVLIIILPLVLGILLLCCLGLLLIRRKRRTKQDSRQAGTESSAKDTSELLSLSKVMEKDPANILTILPSYDLSTIRAATNELSDNNRIGEGGFGVVYKGQLQDGQQIAVKKLSVKSSQGPDEFRNELTVIANLQHRNLVRLLGSCIEGDERMLILEFMENKSLDSFIYDKARSGSLDWQKRLHIISGIARGLLYLHQDSNLRVIHRDLKPSNILLDKDMNPKISDFGIARIFEGDEFHENATTRPVGTFGYMAPEYLTTGIFSFKSDVFSFGVIVLEILSGRRNRIFNQADISLNLLGHAYKLWKEGRPQEILDEALDGSCPPAEILECIRLALLCVQESSENRPTMAEVVMMLACEDQLQTPHKEPTMAALSVNGDSSSSSSKEISSKVTGR